jgi:hypothetical protein
MKRSLLCGIFCSIGCLFSGCSQSGPKGQNASKHASTPQFFKFVPQPGQDAPARTLVCADISVVDVATNAVVKEIPAIEWA